MYTSHIIQEKQTSQTRINCDVHNTRMSQTIFYLIIRTARLFEQSKDGPNLA